MVPDRSPLQRGPFGGACEPQLSSGLPASGTVPGNRAEVWGWVAARADGQPVSVRLVCDTAADRLGIDGVGLSVAYRTGRWEPWCASDELSARVEELQFTIGEGPGADVVAGGGAVLVGDLESPQNLARWPGFAPAAVAAGARAAFAFLLRVGAIQVGVFTCYHSQPRSLSGEQLAECLVFAELALQLMLNEQAGLTSLDGHPSLDGMAMNRAEVHQATGMISVQLGIGVELALARLRAHAFATGRPLPEVAVEVVARRLRLTPDGRDGEAGGR